MFLGQHRIGAPLPHPRSRSTEGVLWSLAIFRDPEGGDPAGIQEPSRRWPSKPPTERGIKEFAPRRGARASRQRSHFPFKTVLMEGDLECSQSDLLGAHIGLRPRRGRAGFFVVRRSGMPSACPDSQGSPRRGQPRAKGRNLFEVLAWKPVEKSLISVAVDVGRLHSLALVVSLSLLTSPATEF